MSLEIARNLGKIRSIVDSDVGCVGATIYIQDWISEAEEREIQHIVDPSRVERMPQRGAIRAKTAVYL